MLVGGVKFAERSALWCVKNSREIGLRLWPKAQEFAPQEGDCRCPPLLKPRRIGGTAHLTSWAKRPGPYPLPEDGPTAGVLPNSIRLAQEF